MDIILTDDAVWFNKRLTLISQKLNIKHPNWDDIKSIIIHQKIKTLILSYNPLSTKGVKEITYLLHKPKCCIKSLSLADTNMLDEGCRYIADALKVNTSLQSLNIQYNRLTNKCSANLLAGLRLNSTLEKLVITRNSNGSCISPIDISYDDDNFQITKTYEEMCALKNRIDEKTIHLINAELDLNVNWKLDLDKQTNYLLLLTKAKHLHGHEITSLDRRKFEYIHADKILYETTFYLYWIMIHYFPRELIYIILENKFWMSSSKPMHFYQSRYFFKKANSLNT